MDVDERALERKCAFGSNELYSWKTRKAHLHVHKRVGHSWNRFARASAGWSHTPRTSTSPQMKRERGDDDEEERERVPSPSIADTEAAHVPRALTILLHDISGSMCAHTHCHSCSPTLVGPF